MLKQNKICWLDLSKLIRMSHNLEPTDKEVMIQYYETVEYIYEEMFSNLELLEKIANFGQTERNIGLEDLIREDYNLVSKHILSVKDK
jgi:hypothetical protein